MLTGLYAITPNDFDESAVEQALQAGLPILQYRDKQATAAQKYQRARRLKQLCQAHGCLLIINDDAELAAAVGADGVHLGQHDGSLKAARQLLGPEAIIGISCYNQMERARQAAVQGADYIAFGAIYPSSSKPQAVRAPLSLIQQAKAELDLPVVAIGGIDRDNVAAVIAAGADMVAMIQGLFHSPDIAATVQTIQSLFRGHHE